MSLLAVVWLRDHASNFHMTHDSPCSSSELWDPIDVITSRSSGLHTCSHSFQSVSVWHLPFVGADISGGFWVPQDLQLCQQKHRCKLSVVLCVSCGILWRIALRAFVSRNRQTPFAQHLPNLSAFAFETYLRLFLGKTIDFNVETAELNIISRQYSAFYFLKESIFFSLTHDVISK